MRWLLLLMVATACEAPPAEGEPAYESDQDVFTGAACGLQVERICGVDGSHPVDPQVDILVELVAPSEHWDAWIEGVPSTTERDSTGDALVLRPDQVLEPGQTYTLWVTDCEGEEHAFDLPTDDQRP